jgi:energy-coupling factor transport system permease protein
MASTALPMTIQFMRINSPLSKVDALSKLIAVFLISIFAVSAANALVLGIVAIFLSINIIVFGRVKLPVFLHGLRIFALFGAGLCIFQILFNHRGDVITSVLFIKVHQGGLEMGLQKWLTAISMGLATLGFIWTTNPREIIAGLVHLGIPYRFAWALFLVMRYVPAFEFELQVIKDAQKVRGIKPNSGLKGKIDILKRYTAPLFISMATKARDIAIAMDCRAFGAFEKRIFRDPFKWSIKGMMMLFIIVTVMAVTIIIFGFSIRQTITF